MLIDYNNKDILNLQEQVLKNANDINDIAVGQLTLANFGIHVSGILSDSTKLPDVSSYTDNDVGTAYLVGTETPYRLYVLTKIASTGLLEWLDIGNFPQPGPKGDKGDKGDTGATGQASLWYLGSTVPTVDPKYTERDCYLNLTNGNVYYYTSGSWSLYGSLRGPRGSIGATGPQGPQGEQGPIGLTGPKGDTGGLVNILGVVATAEDLPAVSTVNDTDAYLVGSTDPYDIYVVIHQPNKQWFNIGTTGSTFSIVNLSVPEGTTSGTLSQGDYNTLQESAQNMIYLNGKYYRLNLDKSTSGYQVYSHTGKNPDNTVYIDEFTITISTKAWVITTINVVDSETLNTKLVGYQKKNSITDIDFPHGEAAVTYDTTNGMGITANVQITNQDGSLYTANGDVHVPIFPGDNITINAKEDGTGVVINGPAAVSKEYVDTELAKKAPLVSSASSTYVTDMNGNTTSIPYTPDATATTFCTRDANGNVSVATPTSNSHATTKEYVDTELAKKAPLVSSASSTYVTDIDGNTTSIPYTSDATASTFCTRDANGNVSVATPTANSHAATKEYVDTHVPEIESLWYKYGNVITDNTALSTYSVNITGTDDSLLVVKDITDETKTFTRKIVANNSMILGTMNFKGKRPMDSTGDMNMISSMFIGDLYDPKILGGNGSPGFKNSLYVGTSYMNEDVSTLRSTDSLISGFKNKVTYLTASNISGSHQNFGGTIITDSIIGGYGNYAPVNSYIERSLIIGKNNYMYNKFIYDNIISGDGSNIQENARQLLSSIVSGFNLQLNPSSSTTFTGLAVFGEYNDPDISANDHLVVGAGGQDSSGTHRRNCFKTGYDGTDSYITVGSTTVTESQLIQLLGLLNPSTT